MGAAEITTALRSKCSFETIKLTSSDKQVRIIGRMQLALMGGWILVVHQLLNRAESGAQWSIDISKQYFLKGGRVVYGWRIIIQAPNIEAVVPDIVGTISDSPHSGRTEVMEMPLMGAAPDRNAPVRGKGADLSGKLRTGPDALAQIRGGG